MTTDRLDYAPFETVTFSGAGWQPGEAVDMVLHEEPNTGPDIPLSVQADGQGKFTFGAFAPDEGDVGVTFTLTAWGLSSGFTAQTAFTDDNVQNDVAANPGSDTFTVGGSTTVSYRIVATGGDGQTGCNASDGSAATVTINTPLNVTATPSSRTFTLCQSGPTSNAQSVVFTASAAGDYPITVSVSDSGTGTYNTGPAAFTLHVLAPPGPTKLSFSTSPFSTVVGQCSPTVTVQTQNTGGTATNPTSNATVNLSSTSGGGAFFSNATCTSSISSVTIPTSGNTASFFYKDTTAGTPTITAAATGLTSATQGETINKASSTTALTCPASVPYTGAAQTPCTALVTGAGGLNQSLTVNYTDNTNAGTASASASFAGDANHDGSSDSKTFTIAKASSTTTLTCPASVTYDGSAQTPCTATVTGAGGLSQSITVNYSNNTNAGTASASASVAGDANHTGSSASKTFTIAKANQTITFVALANKTSGDAPFTVSATGGASGNPVTFTASPAGVCTSSGTNGSTITIVGVGSCTVTAHQAGNSNYNAAPNVD
ncbi:MAG: hypothetical protein ACREMO_12700, partial [Gemmatimonadales bacterium]